MSDPSPVLLKAITYGMRAPNPHNAQAWKIRSLDDLTFLLYVDERRLLLASDPIARQIHMGQGTFIETLSVGMTAEGYETLVDYYPEGEYGIDGCGKKPVARIGLRKKDGLQKDPLGDAIQARVTNRRPYGGPPINESDLNGLTRLTGPLHSKAYIVGEEGKMKEYMQITQEAFKIDISYDAAYEETWRWLRKNDKEIADHKDGLPLRGILGVSNGLFGEIKLKLAESSVSTHEKYVSEKTRRQTVGSLRKQIAASRGFLYLTTSTNTPVDWVRAGRDYARLNLAATLLGLSIHPLSQVLQEYPAMDQLRGKFERLAGQNAGEKIQILVRMGRAGPTFHSPRRDVASIFI